MINFTQTKSFQSLLKTNVPGFMKDPKTGVLHNTNEASIKMAQEARRNWKQQKTLERRIEELEERLLRLESKR